MSETKRNQSETNGETKKPVPATSGRNQPKPNGEPKAGVGEPPSLRVGGSSHPCGFAVSPPNGHPPGFDRQIRKNGEVLPFVLSVDDWAVFQATPERHGWTNLKITLRGSRLKKHNWWLGFNGERFSKTRDAGLLEQHHPEAFAALLHAMKNHHEARKGGA